MILDTQAVIFYPFSKKTVSIFAPVQTQNEGFCKKLSLLISRSGVHKAFPPPWNGKMGAFEALVVKGIFFCHNI